MSYDSMFEHIIVASADGTKGDKGLFVPGYMPVTIRGFAVVQRAVVSCAGEWAIDHQPCAGSATGRVELDVVAVPNAGLQSSVVYVDGLNTRVVPGTQLVAECTNATGAASDTVVVLILEHSPDIPANNTDMTKSA